MAYPYLSRRGRVACAAMVLALSGPAWGQVSKADTAKAASLKKQADELVHESKFKEALDLYDQSFALVPNPAIYYNKARALQSMGDFIGALDAFDKFVANAPADLKSKVPNLDKLIADVASHVSTLVVKANVEGATVNIAGKDVGAAPTQPMRFAPGDVTITVTAPGYVTFTQNTTLQGGETTTIEADLKKVAATQEKATTPEPTPFDQPPSNPNPQPKEQPSSGGSGWRAVAWTSGGLGIVSLGLGFTFMGLALADKSNADPNCPNKVCNAQGISAINEAWSFSTVSTVLVVAGGVLLGLSVVSFIVAPKSQTPVQASLFVGPGGGGIGGTF